MGSGILGEAISAIRDWSVTEAKEPRGPRATEAFGSLVFNDEVQQTRLPKPVYHALRRTMTQGEPLDYLRSGHADRVLAIIGGQDSYTPPADVEALAETGVTIVQYPEAEHGFAHDPARPAHRPEDAADAYARAKEWLASGS